MAALPWETGGDRIAGEQAALRRVATLVARAGAPEEVFSAVTEEAGRLLSAHHATMSRYDPDGAATVVASPHSSPSTLTGPERPPPGADGPQTLL